MTEPAADELGIMIATAAAAAEIALQVRREGTLGLELKGPDDPVTRADRLANAQIVASLARAFPDHGIVAEESVPPAAELMQLVARERVFFVDPIDGTREFAEGRDDFAVMIGLAVRGRAAAGVMAIPAEGLILAGTVGGEATWVSRDGVRSPLRVGSCSAARDATVVVSRSHRPPGLEAILARLGSPRELPCGSVGVKVARVALGDADLYVHPGGGAKKWDSCAPEALLRAAGGELGDVFGERIDYADPDLALRRGMCAGNLALFAEASRAAREVLGAFG